LKPKRERKKVAHAKSENFVWQEVPATTGKRQGFSNLNR
jgi:hypothetical protein